MATKTQKPKKTQTKSQADSAKKLRIIPLGGVGEIGKNMTLFEYGEDIIVVDCGLAFPEDDMPGIDLVIPDITYLVKNSDKIRGYLLTHGHEDHIGATPYVFKQAPAPVFGTRLTLALVEQKLKEHKVHNTLMNVVKPGDVTKLGCFEIEYLKVSHSIAGAVALAIRTPIGLIIHTGDFKIDYTPIDNEQMALGRLAELGAEGVFALLADSTNAERPGYTMSERTVGETFNQYFAKATDRIIVAMFASNIHRIQQVVDAAVRYNRKVCLTGRSMVNVSKLAMQLGELKIPEGRLINVDDVDNYADDELVIMTTGSQGETMAALTRMAYSEHKKLAIKHSDMVIISASPIPGNEISVGRVINQLMHSGANVIYESLAEVHVSGHARQEELRLMYALTRPQYFIPVHGEYRHLHRHAMLVQALGMDPQRIHIAENGDIIECTKKYMAFAGTVPTGDVLIDGLGVGDVGSVVLKDRKLLSEDGLIVVSVAINAADGVIVAGPEIISRGFVYVKESEDIIEAAKGVMRNLLCEYERVEPWDYNALKGRMRDALSRHVYEKMKRSPMVLPVIIEV